MLLEEEEEEALLDQITLMLLLRMMVKEAEIQAVTEMAVLVEMVVQVDNMLVVELDGTLMEEWVVVEAMFNLLKDFKKAELVV